MIFTLNHFCLPKLGNEQADYEDAFAPKISGTVSQKSFSVAVADGATESSFASDWAKMLTRNFVKEPFSEIETLKTRTEMLSQRWQSFVKRRPLPWFAEEKVRFGAFATLLGLQLVSNSDGTDESGFWSAIAIGDSCLFQVRGDNLLRSFPISTAAKFSNSPMLLSSNLVHNLQIWKNVRVYTADWKVGDIFLLATDALACWILSEHEHNERPWNIFLGFREDSEKTQLFRAWADNVRRSSNLKNDDITLLLLKL